jgi:hypothetical protein
MDENSITLRTKLRNYSILAGSFLAASGVANAQIAHHNLDPNVVLNTGGSTYNLDLNGDGIIDAQFFQNSFKPIFYANGFKLKNKNVSFVGFERSVYSAYSLIGVPTVINSGDKIGSTDKWANYKELSYNGFEANDIMGLIYSTGVPGNWVYGENNKFIGFRIKNSSDTSKFNYGWIRCTDADSAKSLTLIDYAIQITPQVPIIAGDTGTGCPYLPVSISAFPKKLHPGDSSRLKLSNTELGETFVWFRNSKAFAVTTGKHSIFVKKAGMYWAEITTPQGCIQNSDTVQIKQLENIAQQDDESVMEDDAAQNIYTANKVLYVKLSDAAYLQNGIIQIYNSIGALVLKQIISSQDFTVNLQSLTSGVYFVKLTNGKTESNNKVFVQ